MMDEAGYVIDQAIEGSKRGIAELKKVRNQVDHYKSIVNTKKAIKDRLIKDMEVTKRALTEELQEELHNQAESTGKTLTQQTQEKLQNISQLADKNSKAFEEEKHAN